MLKIINYFILSILFCPVLGFAQTQIEFHPINKDIIRMAETAAFPSPVKISLLALAAKLEILDRYYRFTKFRGPVELIEYTTYLKNHKDKEIPRNLLESKVLSKLITDPILDILMAFTTGAKDISYHEVAESIDAIYINILNRLFIKSPTYKEASINLALQLGILTPPYDNIALGVMKQALNGYFSDTVTPLKVVHHAGLNSILLEYLFSEKYLTDLD